MPNLMDAIASYLQTAGIGTVGVDIFKTNAPADVDNCIIIYPTGGFEGNAKLSMDSPTFQFYARGINPSLPYDKLTQVYNALQSLSGVTLSDGTYIYDAAGLQSQPTYVRRDERLPPNQRTEYSINFRFETIKKTTNRE